LAPSSIQSKEGASGLDLADKGGLPLKRERQWPEPIEEFRNCELRIKISTNDLMTGIIGFFVDVCGVGQIECAEKKTGKPVISQRSTVISQKNRKTLKSFKSFKSHLSIEQGA